MARVSAPLPDQERSPSLHDLAAALQHVAAGFFPLGMRRSNRERSYLQGMTVDDRPPTWSRQAMTTRSRRCISRAADAPLRGRLGAQATGSRRDLDDPASLASSSALFLYSEGLRPICSWKCRRNVLSLWKPTASATRLTATSLFSRSRWHACSTRRCVSQLVKVVPTCSRKYREKPVGDMAATLAAEAAFTSSARWPST